MHEVDNLIAGLEILKKYKPSMYTYSSGRVRRTLETQEEEFSDLTLLIVRDCLSWAGKRMEPLSGESDRKSHPSTPKTLPSCGAWSTERRDFRAPENGEKFECWMLTLRTSHWPVLRLSLFMEQVSRAVPKV